MLNSQATAGHPRRRVLYVEDDGEAAALIAEELIERGFDVVTVGDAVAALAAIKTVRPDLVLCDVGLPGMSGFELLENLAAQSPRLREMPFLFLTAQSNQASQLQGWRLGADDYLTKPVDYDVLGAVIAARLARVPRVPACLKPVDLHAREVEALTWAARGKTFWEIGQILGLSKRTVEFHLDNAREKLGVATRTQALVKAATEKLIFP